MYSLQCTTMFGSLNPRVMGMGYTIFTIPSSPTSTSMLKVVQVLVPAVFICLVLLHQGMIRVAVSFIHSSNRLIRPRFVTPNRMSSTAASDLVGADLSDMIQVPIDVAIQCHGKSNVKFLDGSWWLGPRETSNRQDYESGPRIAGAHFFDIDDVASPPGSAGNPKNLPHMMPSPTTFSLVMDAMKIKNDDHLIVYGQKACPFVYRAYFQLACMGHDYKRVHMLAGSLHDWMAAGGPVDTNHTLAIRVADLDSTKTTSSYVAVPVAARNVVPLHEMLDLTSRLAEDDTPSGPATSTLLVDVRSPDRFYGRVDEPRPGLRLGHMPGAKNLFFAELLDPEEPTKLKPRSELVNLIENALGPNVFSSDRVIASCGSGATACVLASALLECGMDPSKVYIYDGSWCEWGGESHTPIVND